MATVTGTNNNETLNGTSDSDTIKGLNGEDIINGLGGNDVIDAGKGDDVANGGDGNDVIEAGQGSDTVNAGAGDDVVYGGDSVGGDPANPTVAEAIASSFEIFENNTTNTINGDDGDDFVIGGRGADVIHGDNDHEPVTVTIDVSKDTSAVSASGPEAEDGAAYSVGNGDGGAVGVNGKTLDYINTQDKKDDLKDVEGSETLTIDVGGSAIEATIGLRDLDAGERAKITMLKDGEVVQSTVVEGVDGDPRKGSVDVDAGGEIFDSVKIEALPGDAEILNKSTSFGVLDASFETVAAGDDTIVGGGGNDILKGGYGNDLFIESSAKNGNRNGSDDIDGGAGFDTVDYTGANTTGNGLNPGIVVNLSEGDVSVNAKGTGGKNAEYTLSVTVDEETTTKENDREGRLGDTDYDVAAGTSILAKNGGSAHETDKLTSIEKVIGTGKQDVMVGSEGNDVFVGNGGGDLLLGEGGNDKLNGGDGNDLLSGGADNDKLIGGDGDDTMLGGTGNDEAIGGLGNDTFDGGEGVNTFKVGGPVSASGGVDITLDATGSGTADVDRNGDGGVDETDTLSNVDRFFGTKGDDVIAATADNEKDMTLNGKGGDDTITGGSGDDTLIGGRGNDTIDGGDGVDTYKVGGGVKPGGGAVIDLAAGTAEVDRDGNGTADETDQLTSIENVRGTHGDDVITGNAEANVIKSGRGDDILDGGEGADKLFAGKGNDLLVFDAADFSEDMEVTRTRKFRTDTDDDGVADEKVRVEVTQINEKVYGGGQGYDVLKVEDNADINMLGKGISGIEAIVATEENTVQTVQANLDEIRRESDDADVTRDKGFDTFTFISGNDDGDSLDLFGNGWTLRGDKLGADMSARNQSPTNNEDFLGEGEIAALDAAFGSDDTVTMNNGMTAVDGANLNVFVFQKSNGTFVTVWTDLTAEDITLNGVSLGDEMV